MADPFDLHALSTLPAFILSQDQTLKYLDSFAIAQKCAFIFILLFPQLSMCRSYNQKRGSRRASLFSSYDDKIDDILRVNKSLKDYKYNYNDLIN